uniref:MATH domain-containing protein n=1 Tax=Branchiostoma floridae TaxID=7739 RepID=C3ZG33_BRAFL|eukprot:XP_002592497.1 hypothetical protein BRAFLDRAFT_68988 [Branchiostoma floridae]
MTDSTGVHMVFVLNHAVTSHNSYTDDDILYHSLMKFSRLFWSISIFVMDQYNREPVIIAFQLDLMMPQMGAVKQFIKVQCINLSVPTSYDSNVATCTCYSQALVRRESWNVGIFFLIITFPFRSRRIVLAAPVYHVTSSRAKTEQARQSNSTSARIGVELRRLVKRIKWYQPFEMERGGSDDEGRSGDTPEESRGSPNGQDDNNVLGAQRLRHRVNHLSYLIDTLLHSLAHQSDCREREARLGFVRNELHQLQRIYNDLCNTHAALDNRTREILDTMCEQLFRKLPSIVQQLATCENRRRRDKEKIKELQNRLRSNERILARHETALEERDSRLSTLEFGSYDGKLTWKIDDFKHRRQNAISGKDIKIDSPNFYTSRYGYKMFARIYLDGDGEGKGTHISVFLVIVKGDYDQLLTWPFRQKRPTNTANIASGCPLFVPLSELKNTHRALVKDDTMFMKVTVDVSNLN